MANAQVVITGSNDDTPNIGKIFDSISFFLVQRMPSRSRFVKDIETNGGSVVRIESQADYVIADHMRKDAPAGSYSYTLIEAALRDGQIPDPSEHAIRPADAVREVGSTVMGKATRTPFTIEDDKFLWNWVEQAKAQNEHLRGNEIYKRLETVNPRHTFQSWRDRYIKYLSGRPPAGVTVPANPPPSPPVTSAEDEMTGTTQGPKEFTQDDFDKLKANGADIEAIEITQWKEAWEAFANAESESGHSAEEWSSFWQFQVRPAYLKGLADKASDAKLTIESEPDHSKTADRDFITSDKKRKPSIEQEGYSPDRTKRQRTAIPHSDDNKDRDVTLRVGLGDVQAEQHLETSDPLQLIDSQADDMLQRPQETVLEPVITSDVNAAANMQLELEAEVDNADPSHTSSVDGRRFQSLKLPRFEAELPTSDANRAAEAQFGEWRASDLEGGRDSGDAEDDIAETPPDGTIAQAASASQLALTAENLASQQAQHEPPMTRGTDIPKDEDNADQTGYAEYLHSLIGHVEGERDVISHEETSIGSQLTPLRHSKPSTQLLLSSPQEIDDALEAGLSWPASPNQTKGQPVQARQNPEPTVTYPQLPTQPEISTSQVNDGIEEPAETLMSQLDRPTSSDRHGSGHHQHFDVIFDHENGVDGNEENVDGDEEDIDGGREEHDGDEVDDDSHQGQVKIQRHQWFEDEEEDTDDDGESQDRSLHNRYAEDGKDEDDFDDIDLGVVEPEGGFEDEEAVPPNQDESEYEDAVDDQDAAPQPHDIVEISSDDSSSILSESSGRSPHPSLVNGGSRHAVDTQDIVNAETQKPDLEMPLPPSSDDDLEESFARPSQRMAAQDKGKVKAIETESLDTPEQVNGWVSTMVLRGYRKGAVVKALKRTSMRPDLALLALIEQKAGKGLPTDVSGVWSQDEDELLESGDARGLRDLEKKHGWEEMDARMKFLEGWRALP